MLRLCSYSLPNELKCIKLAVLGITMDSESRNQTAQDIFKENKLSGEIDCQQVGKKKRQSFANRFLFVDAERTNLVPLRTVRNDTLLRDEIFPHLRLNLVGNRDRRDVKSLVELGSLEIRSILTRSVKQNYTCTCT